MTGSDASEERLWQLVSGNVPRTWEVFVGGNWWTRETATSAEHIVELVRGWLIEAYRFESFHGKRVTACIEARCAETSERVKQAVELDV